MAYTTQQKLRQFNNDNHAHVFICLYDEARTIGSTEELSTVRDCQSAYYHGNRILPSELQVQLQVLKFLWHELTVSLREQKKPASNLYEPATTDLWYWYTALKSSISVNGNMVLEPDRLEQEKLNRKILSLQFQEANAYCKFPLAHITKIQAALS